MNLLPDSRLAAPKGTKQIDGIEYEPGFCANCGKRGGWVPVGDHNFVCYVCPPCHEKHGTPAGTYAIPDEVFWAKVNEAQLEAYGRILEPSEITEALKDPNHLISKLAKERPCR